MAPTIRLPRIQVRITASTQAAMNSGTQPPEISFSELAPNSARSIASSGAISSTVRARLHLHRRRATMAASVVVTDMVPVTANP